jgi:hypothetical protein
MEEMGLKLKELGHSCLITSDHDYCMTEESYLKQLTEAEEISKKIDFPIINGLEISMWYEEGVLIGKEVCKHWLRNRYASDNITSDGIRSINTTYKKLPGILSGFDYGLCLVHPAGRDQSELDYSMFHCYEVMNSGCPWPQDRIEQLMKLMPNAKPVKGMDAHGLYGLDNEKDYMRESCNIISDPITNEEQLITWMRNPTKDRSLYFLEVKVEVSL